MLRDLVLDQIKIGILNCYDCGKNLFLSVLMLNYSLNIIVVSECEFKLAAGGKIIFCHSGHIIELLHHS